MSYGLPVDLLEEVLPLHASTTTVVRHTHEVAGKLATELGDEQAMFIDGCERDWEAIGEFHHYISANRNFIPNYGERYRYGETISTAFVESTVNGEETADALDKARSPPVAPGACTYPERRFKKHVLSVVSRHDA